MNWGFGTADTPSGAIRENAHRNRGDLIEEILIDEFESIAKQKEDQDDEINHHTR